MADFINTYSFYTDLFTLLVQPWFLIFVLPMIGALLSVILARFNAFIRNIIALISTGLAAGFALLLVFGQTWGEYALEIMPSNAVGVYFTNSINVDPLSAFMALVAAGLGFLIALFSLEYMKGDEAETRYWFFLQLFVGGMVLLVLAGDLILLYFGWKIVGVCSYFLIGHWFHKPDPQGELCAKSGIKAFLMTLVGDILLLAALGILWLALGTINITDIITGFSTVSASLQVLVALFVLAGAIGKSAQFPLITWLSSPRSVNIDAMQGPTTVSALIHAATMVKAGVYLISRFYFVFRQVEIDIFFVALAMVAVITAFITAASALVSVDIKRVLAYSTVSQLAYMFMGLAIGYLAYSTEEAISFEGFMGTQFHLMSHAIFKALLFLSAGAIIHSLGNERNIKKMGGLKKDLPILHWVTLIGVCALAGIPFLFNGGYSKETILTSAFAFAQTESSYAIFGWLIFGIGIITAFMTAVYAFRFFFLIFYGEKPADLKVHTPGPIMHGVTGLLGGLVIVTGFTTPLWFNAYFEPMFEGYNLHLAIIPSALEGWVTLTIVTAMVALGIGLSYLIYFKGDRTIMPTVRKYWILNVSHTIAKEGFYLDRLYSSLIDLFHWGNWKLRNLQTGDLNYNMSLLGAVALTITVILLFL
ncbi:MAG: NADH-quinone oxidoreductase subunit L [Candidatus Heimdallarchaeota archaeon]|nr:NADH-quinone oxidoreductase subunit L [Candidatus Heimdallarchaeota archaeon]